MNILQNPEYTPAKLLDWMHGVLHLKNDAALSRALKVAPPVISKIRRKALPVGDSMLVKMHDLTGLPIENLRKQMGIGAP